VVQIQPPRGNRDGIDGVSLYNAAPPGCTTGRRLAVAGSGRVTSGPGSCGAGLTAPTCRLHRGRALALDWQRRGAGHMQACV